MLTHYTRLTLNMIRVFFIFLGLARPLIGLRADVDLEFECLPKWKHNLLPTLLCFFSVETTIFKHVFLKQQNKQYQATTRTCAFSVAKYVFVLLRTSLYPSFSKSVHPFDMQQQSNGQAHITSRIIKDIHPDKSIAQNTYRSTSTFCVSCSLWPSQMVLKSNKRTTADHCECLKHTLNHTFSSLSNWLFWNNIQILQLSIIFCNICNTWKGYTTVRVQPNQALINQCQGVMWEFDKIWQICSTIWRPQILSTHHLHITKLQALRNVIFMFFFPTTKPWSDNMARFLQH